jgi:hypothetical protein
MAVTTTTTSTGCKGEVDVLNFFDSSLGHSNLGGAGPDGGVPNMRFENIGTSGGRPYDLIVETVGDGGYTAANILKNGFECGHPSAGCTTGHFGNVNVAGGTSVELMISFQDSETQAPVTLTSFLFSLYDIDQQSSRMREFVYITGFSGDPILATGTEVGVSTEADGRTKLSSTQKGSGSDNPDDPLRLREIAGVDQKKRTAAFLFKGVSSLSMTLEVSGTSSGGRNFFFSGDTNLVTCPGRA